MAEKKEARIVLRTTTTIKRDLCAEAIKRKKHLSDVVTQAITEYLQRQAQRGAA